MIELRRRFGLSLKLQYTLLRRAGGIEAASTGALVDGANRQLDDTEKDHVLDRKALGPSPDQDLGQPLHSWGHLLAALDGGGTSWLGSSPLFSKAYNTPGVRTLLKNVSAKWHGEATQDEA